MPQNITVTMSHFVALLVHAGEENNANGKVQLAQSGELYISKPRSGTKALITNLWASFNALFGNRDRVLHKKQIANTNRQMAAVNKFAELLGVEEIEQNLMYQNNGDIIPYGSPGFFKKYIENNVRDTVHVENKSRADAAKLKPNECLTLNSLPLSGSEDRLNCQDLSPSQRVVLANIYNTLLDLRVVQATMKDENISEFNDAEIALLQLLGCEPELLNRVQEYLKSTRRYIHKISYVYHISASGFASAKVGFSCWNTFWENKLSLEMGNTTMPKLLAKCAFQGGINYLLQSPVVNLMNTNPKEFLFLCHSPTILPTSKEAEELFQNTQILYTEGELLGEPPEYTEVENKDQAGVNNIRGGGALNEPAWDSFAQLCDYPPDTDAIHKRTAEECCVQAGVNDIRELFNSQAWDSFASLCQLNIPKTMALQQLIIAKHANDTLNASNTVLGVDIYGEGITFFLGKAEVLFKTGKPMFPLFEDSL